MGYRIQLEEQAVSVNNQYFSEELLQDHTVVAVDNFNMQLTDVSLPDFHLRSGKVSSDRKRRYTLDFDTPFIESHFMLDWPQGNVPKTFGVFSMGDGVPEAHETSASAEDYSFLEIGLSVSFFEKAYGEDQEFLAPFYREAYQKQHTKDAQFRHITLPMQSVIDSISNSIVNPLYKKHLQKLYLESKATELFLLQASQFSQVNSARKTRLNAKDIESLHAAKQFVEQHFDTPCSIIDLAKKVGVNQMKLKNGFKDLFGNTIFGYVRGLQMEKARQMLLEEDVFVGEVADRVGYKHPHNFAVAFKRKFGVLPSELKG